MTQYVLYNNRIFDLCDGSLIENAPVYRRAGHEIWSAEAFLDEVLVSSEITLVRPFYFNDPIENAEWEARR